MRSAGSPSALPRTARIFDSFMRRRQSADRQGRQTRRQQARPPIPARGRAGEPFHARRVAATTSAAVPPPSRRTPKPFTAATRSSIRDDATKPTFGALAAQQRRGVDQEPAAAAELEIGVKHRFAGRGQRLDDPVPAVHLVDQVAVDARGAVRLGDLLRLFLARGQRRDELELRAGACASSRVDARHDRPEVEALVRPVRPVLLLAVQRVDDPDPGPSRLTRRRQAGRPRAKRPAAATPAVAMKLRRLCAGQPAQAWAGHPAAGGSTVAGMDFICRRSIPESRFLNPTRRTSR